MATEVNNLPSPLYIPLQGLETYFVNKLDGTPLSGGFLKFFRDTALSTTKDVYIQAQQPDNSYIFVNVGPIIPLTAVGTTQNPNDGTDAQIYLFPWSGTDTAPGAVDLYFIQVLSSDNILQFTRQAQPPNVSDINTFSSSFQSSDNQISNPQFVELLNTNSATSIYTVTTALQVTPIAPDWSIVTTGNGTVTVTQENIVDVSVPTSPPFAVNLTASTGISLLILRQTITNSPRLFNQGFVSSSLIAKSLSNAVVPIKMDYVASNGYTVNLIQGNTTSDDNYTVLQNELATFIDSTNTAGGTLGYVNIDITIGSPASHPVGISSVQVLSTSDENAQLDFTQESVPRQIDHLYHYWEEAIFYKPIPSYLVGWDFPVNPAQFGLSGTVSIAGGLGQYICDQTILWQSATNGVSYSLASGTNAYSALVLTAAADTQLALIQYLGYDDFLKFSFTNLSAGLLANTNQSSLPVTISLWYTTVTPLPNVAPTFNLTLLSGSSALDANGHPIGVVSGWVEIKNTNGTGLLNTPNLTFQGVSGWLRGQIPYNATFFAIVIGTGVITSGNYLSVVSASLVPGDIPTIPAAQTADEVLRECQYYYEKSWDPSIVPGTSPATTTNGQQYSLAELSFANPGLSSATINSYQLKFREPKRTDNAVIGFYSPDGTKDNLQFAINRNNTYPASSTGTNPKNVPITDWVAYGQNIYGCFYRVKTSTFINITIGAIADEAYILYHYIADDRLGIV